MTFFVIRSDFVIFPYLQKRYISLRFREIFYSFTVLQNLPLISLHLPVLSCFTCFSFPLLLPWCIYASYNARTGRP